MATTTFDTYKAVLSLQKRGLSKDAAEGNTELLKDVTESNLVTRDDLELALHRQSLTLIKGCRNTHRPKCRDGRSYRGPATALALIVYDPLRQVPEAD